MIMLVTCDGVKWNNVVARYEAKLNPVAAVAEAKAASAVSTSNRARTPGRMRSAMRAAPPRRSMACSQRVVSGRLRRR